jgi:hypothetical protein
MNWTALSAALTLVLGLATVGTPSMPSEADTRERKAMSNSDEARANRAGDADVQPFQDVHFGVCPCWLTAKELVEEIEQLHSDISFECHLSIGTISVEISASSSGVGGPFRSEVSTAQQRSASDSRCRHIQFQPQVIISASEDLRTLSQRSACLSIVSSAAARLGCTE